MSYEPVLVTASDHPLAKLRRLKLADVAKYPLILPPRQQSTYRIVQQAFAAQSLEPDVKFEVGGYEVIKTYVKLGLGISIVMSHCLQGDEPLHTASLKRWLPKREYGLVLRKGQALSPATTQFVQLVRKGQKKR